MLTSTFLNHKYSFNTTTAFKELLLQNKSILKTCICSQLAVLWRNYFLRRNTFLVEYFSYYFYFFDSYFSWIVSSPNFAGFFVIDRVFFWIISDRVLFRDLNEKVVVRIVSSRVLFRSSVIRSSLGSSVIMSSLRS